MTRDDAIKRLGEHLSEDYRAMTDDGPAREASQELRAHDLPLGTSVLYGDGTLQPVLLG